MKYLGITITGDLKWSTHCCNVARRATRTLNLLRRTIYGCSSEVKKTACLALVRPHLEYCAPVWSPRTKKDRYILERVQKRTAHWICSKWSPTTFSWSKTYEEELQELKWLSVTNRHEILSLSQEYKIVNSLDCIDFRAYFTLPNMLSRHSTLQCGHSRIIAFRYSLFTRIQFIWNKLPLNIQVMCRTHLSKK